MHTTQILTLLLALSGAVNVAFAAAITARAAGATPAQAILTGRAAPERSWPSSSPPSRPTSEPGKHHEPQEPTEPTPNNRL